MQQIWAFQNTPIVIRDEPKHEVNLSIKVTHVENGNLFYFLPLEGLFIFPFSKTFVALKHLEEIQNIEAKQTLEYPFTINAGYKIEE